MKGFLQRVISFSMYQHDQSMISILLVLLPTFLPLQVLYTACGGNHKGLGLKDLVCGLVLMTRGKQEEKLKCKAMKRLMV